MSTVYNKVTLNGNTIIDISSDTVAADKLHLSYTAHGADGNAIVGTASTASGTTINNQTTYVTPTESEQVVTYDSSHTGLSTVTVGAISSTYVGSGISTRDSSSLSVSGSTITAPSGYYANNATYAFIDGNNLEYGIIDDDSALIGVGVIDYMEVE